MSWYKNIQNILNQEPETWLTYNLGRNLDKIPHLSRNKPPFRGLFWRSIRLFHWVIGLTKLRRRPLNKAGESYRFLVFSDTVNQITSLDTTVDNLRGRGEAVLAIANGNYINTAERKNRYVDYKFGLVEVVMGLMIFIRRAPALIRTLKTLKPIAVSWYFNNFCANYFYLAFFYRVLNDVRPEFVITANDHNFPNRCMLAVAHYLGIKTVYLQHASVGTLFPALRVNYAFLDGQSALDTYLLCEPNRPADDRELPVPHIFLTGQKKPLPRKGTTQRRYIGFAVNTLDKPEAAVKVANQVAEAGYDLLLRWHPAQSKADIQKYVTLLSGNSGIHFSDPRREAGSAYMEKIRFLIAGNTSILLEAAIAGAFPIYYELQPPDKPDVYGFVRQGLATHARSVDEILDLINQDKLQLNEDAVRYFSATFHTEWEGREGELVADCLMKLANGVDVENLFGYESFSSSKLFNSN